MMQKPDPDMSDLRHESKIPLQRDQYMEFESALMQRGLRPKTTYPDRVIHSIYLDDHELNDYHDNISGLSRRSKTRIRWYNNDVDKLAVEIKRKIIKVSDKKTIRVDNNSRVLPRRRSDLMRFIRANSEKLPVSDFIARFPVVEVAYHRRYFELASGIRMTTDSAIRYRKLYPQPSPKWHLSPVNTVVEFKYPPGKEDVFGGLLRDIPYRVFRHSKYVIGMECACAG